MKTLYDLLGALPDDDADELRAAFRKAAKANHPDNNPDNPETAERFRKIVRAHAILSDGQQRAAYDRMLVVVRRQQGFEPKRRAFSGMLRRLAADAAASAVVSVVLIGGYLLYRPYDGPPDASSQITEASARRTTQAPIVKAAELSEAHAQAEQHDLAEQHDPVEQHSQAEQHDKLQVAAADTKPDIDLRDVIKPTEPGIVAPAVNVEPLVTTVPLPRARRLRRFPTLEPGMPNIIGNGASRPIASAISTLRSSISIWRSTSIPLRPSPISIAASSSAAWAI
jgi:hypothetical protein